MNVNVYIAQCDENGGISRYSLSKDGLMEFIDNTPVKNPMYLEVSGNSMHVILRNPFDNSKESGVMSYDILKDGSLSKPSTITSTGGEVACHIAVDGKDIYCANYTSGSVAKINEKLVLHEGKGPHPTRQTKAHTHFVCVTRDKKYVLAVDLGIDTIFVYDKNLNKISAANVPAGHGPRHLAFSHDQSLVYCVNELASTVSVFDFFEGKLNLLDTYSSLPKNFKGINTSAAIRVSKDGKYVYVSNRGHNSISCFKTNGKKLELINTVHCGGESPRDFNIFGNYLICTNEKSNNVTVFNVVGADLKYEYSIEKLLSPLCVVFKNYYI